MTSPETWSAASGAPSLPGRSQARRGVTLSELVAALQPVEARGDGNLDRIAYDLQQDSRRIEPGHVFAVRAGARTNGARFIEQATQRGAIAVLAERGSELSGSLPVITVSDIRLGIALAAEALHGFPSRAIDVAGITGTNGKTTSAWLTATAIRGAGGRAARLGTLGFAFGNELLDASLTTPQADEISRYAARVRDGGGTHLVMEVSSHALAQARVDALEFKVAAFTNLTQDHLDYHGSMEDYAAAKQRLFTELGPEVAVVNVDDPFGERLVSRTGASRVWRVSKQKPADVRLVEAELGARGISARVELPSGVVRLESRLVGEHNLDNLLIALAIVAAMDLDPEPAARALSSISGVPGRLERCDVPADDVTVLVDYAHTPDALERALQAARSLTQGCVACVFGCGGDRDPLKRPLMGDAVGRLADRAIVTNDNPRSERPEDIAAAVERGLRAHATRYSIELDRKQAIQSAVEEADPGDVVLIAGKGHEPYQIIGAETQRFDDRVEARRALALRRQRLGR
jgi:UDP-N-acetylmuramoyl-L-alanyl-D-glutamate--2,6-diaminopimelate ligase